MCDRLSKSLLAVFLVCFHSLTSWPAFVIMLLLKGWRSFERTFDDDALTKGWLASGGFRRRQEASAPCDAGRLDISFSLAISPDLS